MEQPAKQKPVRYGMIIPAVSSNATIETNHVMSLAPDCVPGNNACRMQLDKYEALKIAGVDMTSAKPIKDAFAVLGEYIDRLGELTSK